MSLRTSELVLTTPESVGTITLEGADDLDEEFNLNYPLNGDDANDTDPLLTSPKQIASTLTAGFRPVALPSSGISGLNEDSEELLHPPIPVSSARILTNPPSIYRNPPRAIRARSLPPVPLGPLSDGPRGHTYMPVSTRPARLESLGPFEQFPRPQNRTSMISYIGSICEPDDTTNGRAAGHVFSYTPDMENAILHTKTRKWYTKSAAKVKQVKGLIKLNSRK